jgi:periplasmic divalent cation tolerance protein
MNQNATIIVIETTVANEQDAKKIATDLLNLNLIACTNIQKIQSIYNWDSKNCEEIEFLLSLKTNQSNKQETIEKIKSIHPYELPMIIIKIVETTNEYQNWIKQETN